VGLRRNDYEHAVVAETARQALSGDEQGVTHHEVVIDLQ
jgi:hypothetical protein